MKTPSFSLILSVLFGCTLFDDGTINQTCDDLGTCGGVSDGGIVYVEQDENAGRWKVSLLDGYGEEIDSWSGQGTKVGGVAYDEQSQTVHLSVDTSIRVLQSNGTPKINNVLFSLQAISVGGSTAFGDESGILIATNDESIFNNLDFPNFQSILGSASLTTGADTSDTDIPLLAVLQHLPNAGPTISEVATSGNELVKILAVPGFDNSTNRAHDAFLMKDAYATCSKTGATYLVGELKGGNKDPDRYPQVNFGDIASCEYDAVTDEVVLFSESNGIGWMDASGKIVRTKDGTDGYRIVNGSVW
jgi:hypothetical protein